MLTLAVYLPALHAGFIWDDDDHLTKNPCVVGPLGFVEIWTTAHAVYYPLVLTTFWILHKFVGLNPLPYHLLNVLLHAGSAILLWRVLLQLRVRGAWLGAALWALHPVMVQSVAWITELKNTQSCFFYLLAILFFLKSDPSSPESTPKVFASRRPGRRRCYLALSLFFFAAAITSKTSTVMLPFILGLCVWWKRGRLRGRDLAVLAPFLFISVAASGWTIWEQKFHSGAFGPDWAQTWIQRVVIAGCDLWFYAGKLIWPNPLIFIYPRWRIDAAKLITFLPTLTAAGGLLVLSLKRNGPLRPLFFAAAYFVISLFPVLGFFNVYFFRYSFVSDHFQYLASMGPLALLGAGFMVATKSIATRSPIVTAALGALLLGLLGTLTWRQTRIYSDLETLYQTTIAQNPQCWMAQVNLGNVYLERGERLRAIDYYRRALAIKPDYAEAESNIGLALLRNGNADDAVVHFKKALEIRPDYAEGHYNFGTALIEKGQVNEAIDEFQKALRFKPIYPEARYNLGTALLRKGDIEEAAVNFETTLELKPDYPEAHNNLGIILVKKGRLDEAITHFQKALAINPQYAEADSNLGLAVAQKGELDEAVRYYRKAIEIKPDYAEAHFNLGNVLAGRKKLEEAAAEYARALEIRPDYTEAHYNLGTVLLQLGRSEEAFANFDKAIALQPSNAALRNDLAWLLATSSNDRQRNGAKAVKFAQEANQLGGGNNASTLDTLAAAYAESGDFQRATETAERALDLAISAQNKPLMAEIEERLELYRRRQPYRQK